MRSLVVVLSLASLACSEREDCCDLGSTLSHLERGVCADQGGTTVSEYLCEGVEDADPRGGDTDATDGSPDTLPDDQAGRCRLFCEFEMAQCPTDDLCEHSCNDSTTAPEQADIDCAAAATTCEETFPCWDFQTFE